MAEKKTFRIKNEERLAFLRCYRGKKLIFNRSNYLFIRVQEDGREEIVRIRAKEESFLAAIHQDAEDCLSIMVYADYLEDVLGLPLPALDIRHRVALYMAALKRAEASKKKPRRISAEQARRNKLFEELEALDMQETPWTKEQRQRNRELRHDVCVDCGYPFPGEGHRCRLDREAPRDDEQYKEEAEQRLANIVSSLFENP